MPFPTKYAAGANKYFVNSKTGRDSRAGDTSDSAWLTIGNVGNTSGRTLYIFGSFADYINITNTSLTMIGDGYAIIDCSGNTAFAYAIGTLNISYITVKNFSKLLALMGGGNTYTLSYCNFVNGDLNAVSGSYQFIFLVNNCLFNKIKRHTYSTSYVRGSNCTFANGTATGEEVLLENNVANKNHVFYNQKVLISIAPIYCKNLYFDSTCTFKIGTESSYTSVSGNTPEEKIANLRARCASAFGLATYLPASYIGDLGILNPAVGDFTPTLAACLTGGDTGSYVGYFNPNLTAMKIYSDDTTMPNCLDNATKSNVTIAANSAQLTSPSADGTVYSKIFGNGVMQAFDFFYQFLQQGYSNSEYLTTKPMIGGAVNFGALSSGIDYRVSADMRFTLLATQTSGALVSGQVYRIKVKGTTVLTAYLDANVATNSNEVGSVFVSKASGTPTWDGTTELQLISVYLAGKPYRNLTGDAENLGEITGVTLNAGGTGYSAGNILTIAGGDGLAAVKVLTVSGGVVTSVQLVNPCGLNYTTGTNIATTGAGSNCTINITSVRTSPTYNTFTEYRKCVGLRWLSFPITNYPEITGGTLEVGAAYIVVSGVVTYNGQIHSAGDSFHVISGVTTFSGGTIKKVFSASDTFKDFSFSDNIRCLTTDNNALAQNQSNLYLTTGDYLYYDWVLSSAKSEKAISAMYFQYKFNFAVNQI